MLFLGVLAFPNTNVLFGQAASPSENNWVSALTEEELLPIIEAGLHQAGGDTASLHIMEKVRSHCGHEYECLRLSYRQILVILWYKSKFIAGIPVVEEEARLAELHGDLQNKIDAYEGLTGFHWWAGQSQQFYFYMEKLVGLYEKANRPHKAIETKVSILDGKAWYLNEVEELLPELNKLLAEAIEIGHALTEARIRAKIMNIAEGFELYDLWEEQITELEKYPFTDPPQL